MYRSYRLPTNLSKFFNKIFRVAISNTSGPCPRDHYSILSQYIYYMVGPPCSWSYGSCVCNYLCNQCLSPLTLRVWIQLRRGVLDTALCDKFVSDLWQVGGFLRALRFIIQYHGPPRYSWNNVESGVKHHTHITWYLDL